MRSPEDLPRVSTSSTSSTSSSLSLRSVNVTKGPVPNKSSLSTLPPEWEKATLSQRHNGGGDNCSNFNEFKVPPPPVMKLSSSLQQKNKSTPKAKPVTTSTNVHASNKTKPKLSLKKPNPIAKSKSTEILQQSKGSEPILAKKSESDEKLMELDPDVGKLYNVGRRLGKGAYGIVWEAKDKVSGRQVALKKIYEAFRNATDAQRTYREIVFLKTFGHHPNIISVIGAHKAANKMDLYLVFPYMKYDLYKVIEHHPEVLTEKSTRHVAYQLAIALNYLHSAEVIHRDLKPANILMDDKLHVELADLGLSRSLPYETTGSFPNGNCSRFENNNCDQELTDYVATRWYRPPEIIISSRIYSKAMDLWAFGCILGEMLLKKVMFPGDSASHQLHLIMETISPPTDKEIDDICSTVDSKNANLLKGCSRTEGTSISEMFLDFDCATVDIIERLLCFAADKRLSIQEVLAHPFFSSVRDPMREYKSPGPFTPSLCDSTKLKVSDYQEIINKMVDGKEVFSDHLPYRPSRAPHPNYNNIGKGAVAEKINIVPPPPPRLLDEEEFENSSEEDYYKKAYKEGLQTGDNSESNSTLEDSEEEEDYSKYVINATDNLNSNIRLEYEESNKLGISLLPIPIPKSYSELSQRSQSHAHVSIPIAKSASVSAATASSNNNSLENRPKNLSILTIPSAKRDESGNPNIFKKFELLCKKHEVDVEEFGSFRGKTPIKVHNDYDTIYASNSLKNIQDNNKDEKGLNHYDYIPQSSFRKPKGSVELSSVSLIQGRNVTKESKRLQQSNQGGGDSIDNFCDLDDFDYNDDMKRIQNTMAKSSGTSKPGFINPYKPKGLKTSTSFTQSYNFNDHRNTNNIEIQNEVDTFLGEEEDDYLEQLCHDKAIAVHERVKTRMIETLPPINELISISIPNEENKLNLGAASFNTVKGSNSEKSGKLNDFFPSKEAFQDRIRQIESRIKGKSSMSQDAIHHPGVSDANKKNYRFGAGSIPPTNNNERNGFNSRFGNDGSSKSKLPTDYSKTKFSFNPYARLEEDTPPPPPRRPFAGRSYSKTLPVPTFKKTQATHSFSDTEAMKANSEYKRRNYGQGVTATAHFPQQIHTHGQGDHSAYFPNKSKPKPRQIHSKVTTSKNGFAVIHPIPRNNMHKSSEQLRHQSLGGNNNMHSAKNFNAPDSVTIRASELLQLRSSLRNSVSIKGPGAEQRYL